MEQPEKKLGLADTTIEYLETVSSADVKAIIQLDKEIFPSEMHVEDKEIIETLESEGVQVVLRENGEIIGYIISLPHEEAVEFLKEDDPEITSLEKGLYVESIGIKKEKRNATNFLKLFGRFLDLAWQKGFKVVSAHTRVNEGLSNVVQRRFGAIQKRRFENWAGFGEPFDYIEIDLTKRETEE